MFLVCTADERFWRVDQPILFLGEWCKLHARRAAWERLPAEVLPYHWDDPARFAGDFALAERLAGRVIDQLAAGLNGLHGVRYPRRSWDIAVGNMISDLAGVVLDRHRSIQTAAEDGRVTSCRIEEPAISALVPRTIAGMRDLMLGIHLSNQLYGRFIRSSALPFEVVPAETAPLASPRRAPESQLRRLAVRTGIALNQILPRSASSITLVDSYFRKRELSILLHDLKQSVVLRQGTWDWPSDETPVNHAARETLNFDLGDDEYALALGDAIRAHLPVSLIEGFSEMAARVDGVFPRRSSVIVTANAHVQSDAFKIWTAKRIADGATLVVHQHGGLYGTAEISAIEHYERRVSDRYLSWGWTEPDTGANVERVPASKLVNVARRIRPDAAGGILLGCSSNPLQFYRFASMPVAGQTLAANREHIRFIKRLSPEAFGQLSIRLFPEEYGWDERGRFLAAIPSARFADLSETMYAQLNRSRLFVCNNNQTTHLETMAANFPTVIVWNPALWRMRPAAADALKPLAAAGIFHADPEAAADFVSSIAEHPGHWWGQPGVQSARRDFCERYAWVSDDWRREWRRILRDVRESMRAFTA